MPCQDKTSFEQSAPIEAAQRMGFWQMKMLAAILAPAFLFFPGRGREVDLAKLTVLGALFATFFLFAGKIWLPGGGAQFFQYASAIIQDTTLPASVAQRDAGYPLLIILSGYPITGSLIGLLLFQAAFAIMAPLLIYEGLQRLSPFVAFYSGLISLLSLTPFYFMKMLHHDQTYIFFSVLSLSLLVIFVQSKETRFLYSFILAASCASVTRPAGNALVPIFLLIGYLTARGRIVHYAVCLVIFGTFVGLYAWHRYLIFDVENVGSVPSYAGEQIFYNPYVNALDYGIHLSPKAIGANFTLVIEHLRAELQPSPKRSTFIAREIANNYTGDGARQFADANILPLTANQLIDRVLSRPNYEYWSLLSDANDDRLMFKAALELMRTYPGLVLQYFARNLFHVIFAPGYKHSRYNLDPSSPAGLEFYPANGYVSPEGQALLPRAVRELNGDSTDRPIAVRYLFKKAQFAWRKSYKSFTNIVGGFMSVAWITGIVGLVNLGLGSRLKPANGARFESRIPVKFESLAASIIVASLLFGYNAAVTALFVDPDFRYRQMIDLQAILIAGLGATSLWYWLCTLSAKSRPYIVTRWSELGSSVRALDFWQRRTKLQLASIGGAFASAGLVWWTLFTLKDASN
jgi:hypothetical protein